jgi:plastocyanin
MRPFVLACLLAAALFAGCSSPSSSTSSASTSTTGGNPGFAPPEPETIHLSATGSFAKSLQYSPDEFTVISGGEVTVLFHNDVSDGVTHNWKIDGVATIANTAPGANHETTFTAPQPGTYTYYCSIGTHRASGLEGTMTVAVS